MKPVPTRPSHRITLTNRQTCCRGRLPRRLLRPAVQVLGRHEVAYGRVVVALARVVVVGQRVERAALSETR